MLYEECGHDKIKSKNEVVAGFLAKFQTVVHNYDKLRVNIGDFQVSLPGSLFRYFFKIKLFRSRELSDAVTSAKLS